MAQFLAYHEVRKQRDGDRYKVANAISELKSDIVKLGGRPVNMARLFWIMRQYFVQGIKPNSMFSSIRAIFQEATIDECHEAEHNLMFKLRLLELIRDDQRMHLKTGYIEIITHTYSN